MGQVKEKAFPKNQHYVSKSILKHFANDKKEIYSYSFNPQYYNDNKPKNIKSICSENYYFKIQNLNAALQFADILCKDQVENIRYNVNVLDDKIQELFENNELYQGIVNKITNNDDLMIEEINYLLKIACSLFLRSPRLKSKGFAEKGIQEFTLQHLYPLAKNNIEEFTMAKAFFSELLLSNIDDFYRVWLLNQITNQGFLEKFPNELMIYTFLIYETTYDYPFIIGESHGIFKPLNENFYFFPISSLYCLVIDLTCQDNTFLTTNQKKYKKEIATKKQVDSMNREVVANNKQSQIFSSNEQALIRAKTLI